MIENFFGHLKKEFYRPVVFASTEDFLTQLGIYIDWCNTVRIKEKLEGLSPVQYRAKSLQFS